MRTAELKVFFKRSKSPFPNSKVINREIELAIALLKKANTGTIAPTTL